VLSRNNIIIILTIFISFILDRISKIIAINFFIKNDLESFYFNPFLNFILIWNQGVAFGLFDSEDIKYHLISSLVFLIMCFLIFLLLKSKLLFEKFSYALVIGGALGNFFDRLYYGAVPDFIDFHLKDFHWFTFNVADICITIGIVFLIIFDTLNIKMNNNEK
jgi:signal peptidase II